ncbi:MAG TPA: helix-turn-helix transcriptional regulator [Candidatus Binataceae bacterium]
MKSTTIVEEDLRARLSQILVRYGSVANLARAVGVSDNAIYKWIAGRGQPTVVNLVALARAGRVSVEWLATGREAAPSKRSASGTPDRGAEYTFAPRYDFRVATGRGAPMRSEQVVDYLAFKTEWVQQQLNTDPHNLLLIEAVGDSMAPTLEHSDLLLVDLSEPRFRQDGVYVLRRNDELIVKRLQRRADGKLVIRSDNPAYEPLVVAPEGVGIIGRVIWAAGRL